MEELDVTTETVKATVRKPFRVKLFSFLQPGDSHNSLPSPMWQPQGWPRADRSRGPDPTSNAKPQGEGKGAAREDQENKAKHKNTGIPGRSQAAARTCYFFCGEVQKSNVIIADYMLWRPCESSENAPFQSKQKWEFALFLLILPSFSPSMSD